MGCRSGRPLPFLFARKLERIDPFDDPQDLVALTYEVLQHLGVFFSTSDALRSVASARESALRDASLPENCNTGTASS